MRTTCRCGATWTGERIEHCTVCHQTFTGTSAGDRHRTGDHAISIGSDRRRCLTVEEMLARGLRRNDRGQWTNGGVSPWAKPPESEGVGRPRSDERPLPGVPGRSRGSQSRTETREDA